MPPRTKVLIIDDSVVNRRVMINLLETFETVEVAGFAADGTIGWAKVLLTKPDVILVDIDMPEMSGIDLLKKLRKNKIDIPVIMLSDGSDGEAEFILDAMAYGAQDYAVKPDNMNNGEKALKFVKTELMPKINKNSPYYKDIVIDGGPATETCGTGVNKFNEKACADNLNNKNNKNNPNNNIASVDLNNGIKRRRVPRVDVLAVGVSTGGPKALEIFLSGFNGQIDVPVLIVQHMPPQFTKLLAERLSVETKLNVTEGASGSFIETGKVFLAPGDYHMIVKREAAYYKIELNQHPPENSCRPAVDVLFRTVADIYGENALAVVLTGMGQDGLIGCEHIKKNGGRVIVQDKDSSVVWGMPGAVANNNLADCVLPLEELAAEVINRINMGRQGSR